MERNKSCSIYSTPWSRTVRVYSTPGVDLEWNKCYSVEYPRLLETLNFMHNKQCVSIGNPQSSEYNNFLGTQSVNFEFNKLFTLHSGLMLLFIRDLDSVLLYVVKVMKSYDNIGTMCNQFSLAIRAKSCTRFCLIPPWPILLLWYHEAQKFLTLPAKF